MAQYFSVASLVLESPFFSLNSCRVGGLSTVVSLLLQAKNTDNIPANNSNFMTVEIDKLFIVFVFFSLFNYF